MCCGPAQRRLYRVKLQCADRNTFWHASPHTLQKHPQRKSQNVILLYAAHWRHFIVLSTVNATEFGIRQFYTIYQDGPAVKQQQWIAFVFHVF